jgi:hypothetical protein
MKFAANIESKWLLRHGLQSVAKNHLTLALASRKEDQ